LMADLTIDFKETKARLLAAVTPRTSIQFVAAVFLVLGTAGIYLQCLNPHNLSYDARWYHLPIAEYYTAAGGIRRFNEGWYLGTYPQLANLLYTWALQAPGTLFDHVLICAHLEFALFVATLGSVSILAARLLRRPHLPFAGATVFLFPELFAYDSNLNCGADHVLAFWAPAVGITLIRFGSRFSNREAMVSALMMGGAILTKYQAIYLFVPALLFIAAIAIRKRHCRSTAALWLVTVGLITAPHWAKNWAYYGDPLYPLLHRYLPSRPFHSGAEALLEATYWPKQFSLDGTLGEKLQRTLQALVNFSFLPNDWPEFHGQVPIFGSLFTLVLPLLLLVRATRRLWLLVIGVHVGIAVWYVLSHQDRFLQGLVPWMAAGLAAIMALAWSCGILVRSALVLLVSLQWAWGSDVYFFRTHSMSGDSPVRATGDFLGAAHRGEYEQRLRIAPTLEKLGAALPADARVLFHHERLRFGLGRQFIEDSPGWQGGIEYLDTTTPEATRALLENLGVTHALWLTHRNNASRENAAREAVFERAVALYVRRDATVDGWNVGTLKSKPTDTKSAAEPTLIAWLSCDSGDKPGLYTPRELANATPQSSFGPTFEPGGTLSQLARANVVLTNPSCPISSAALPELPKEFVQTLPLGNLSLWVRNHTH